MCLVYLDDILVFGKNFREHQDNLQAVLSAIYEAGLKFNPEKCQFAIFEVAYLGHGLTSEGIRPHPDKVRAIQCFPSPQDVSSLRSFLGVASYYRRFISNFAQLVSPLHRLLKKNSKWTWEKVGGISIRNPRCHREISYASTQRRRCEISVENGREQAWIGSCTVGDLT